MKQLLVTSIFCLAISQSHAIPISLDGMGLASRWTDCEVTEGEMPVDAWGISNDVAADRIGVFVEFDNGLISWAVYSGLSVQDWGVCCTLGGSYSGIQPDQAEGFLSGVGMHGLDQNNFVIAWNGAANPFAENFDLTYTEKNKSNFRASKPGWESVEIGLYSSAYATIPEPGMLTLLAAGLAGIGVRRFLK